MRKIDDKMTHISEELKNTRLQELSKLEKGWLDGHGEAIDELSLYNADILLLKIKSAHLPYPSADPTESGGILMKWVKLVETTGHFISVEINGDQFEFDDLSLTSPETPLPAKTFTNINELVKTLKKCFPKVL